MFCDGSHLEPGQVGTTSIFIVAVTQVKSVRDGRQLSGGKFEPLRSFAAAAAMAESQLMCMEDGHIGVKVLESKPEFYYSEEQRAAIEELLKNGDGAFKTRLKEDNMKDFLSAREVKVLVSTFKQYDSNDSNSSSTVPTGAEQGASGADADSGVHSTYWPQMSDTEVPSLDIGWPSGGFFKGVTRVAVHTHPPKDNGPHIKEVVRRLIQEASKVRSEGQGPRKKANIALIYLFYVRLIV